MARLLLRRYGVFPGGFIWLLLLLVACGTAATPTAPSPTATAVSAPAATRAATSAPLGQTTAPTAPRQAVAAPSATAAAPSPTPEPTEAPTPPPASGKDRIILVTSDEPLSMDGWTTKCTANLVGTMCGDNISEPFTWITSDTFEVVPLSGVQDWEQIAPNRWRFNLTQGVKFHNGEPWNAETAKAGLDMGGDPSNGLDSYTFTGVITGEVVDEDTVDVVCERDCPILPRGAIFTRFQAPEWYRSAPEEERARKAVGIGPYMFINWEPGVAINYEAYANYKPNEAADSQAPVIKHARQVWRGEALVRAAMLNSGEADWAMDLGFENFNQVPVAKTSGTTEVFTLVLDTMWHPELKKKAIRQALAQAIDCQSMLDAIYNGQLQCHSAIAVKGTIGITDKNSAPYPYDPARSRQLLAEAGYSADNKIIIYVLPNRAYRDVEVIEAVASFWKEVGVNVETQALELARYTDTRSSGCGRFNNEPGYKEALDCASRQPPQPLGASSHAFTTVTSDEILDLQVQGDRRLGCFNVNSRVCYPELQKKIDIANATPPGPERARRMEEIGDISHEEVYFIPFYAVQMVYGMGADLSWNLPYSPRLRVNTMRFAQ